MERQISSLLSSIFLLVIAEKNSQRNCLLKSNESYIKYQYKTVTIWIYTEMKKKRTSSECMGEHIMS